MVTMKLKAFHIASFASFILLALVLRAPEAHAQHVVLFETFTNSCEPQGTDANATRTAFNSSVNSVVSSEGPKIIHLDHHIGNLCDALQNTYSWYTANYVMP